MSRILKVSQTDYRLQVRSGGNIVLDTGTDTGTVTITGNLDVKGTTTTVESTNTTIQDNILLLNYDPDGNTGDGISSTLGYQSGIEINRGIRDAAQFVFSEQVLHYDSVSAGNIVGTFRLLTANSLTNSVALSGLQVRSITNDGTADLIFDLQNSTPVIRIANSTNYESRVTDPNHIPNKKYVNDYVSASGGMANVTSIHYPLLGPSYNTVVETKAATIDFTVNSVLKAQIGTGGVTIDNILISNDTITNTSLTNLTITATTNNVEVDAVLNLNNQLTDQTAVSGKGKLYTKAAEGPGRTGLYFVNNTPYGSNSYNRDELVSKNRAVLLSILL